MTYQNTKRPSSAAMLSVQRWNELSDFIDLAKDALGEKPEDFDRMFFENCEAQLKSASEILAHRRRLDRPWAKGGDGEWETAVQDETPTERRICEAMRIIRSFARVIDAQAPREGQFGIPSVTLDIACGELEEALRLEGVA